MKKVSKLIALLLAISMVFSMLPVFASAEEAEETAVETPVIEEASENATVEIAAEAPAETAEASEEAAAPAEEAAAPAAEEVTLQPEEQEVYLVGDETVGTVSVDSNSQYASFTRTFTQADIDAKASGKILKATNADGKVEYYDRLTKANILTETKKNKADRTLTLLGDFTVTDADGTSATNCLEISGTNGDWGSGNYGDLTVDLNGYTLTYNGTANLFVVSRYGFTLENGNIDYNGTAGRSVVSAGTTTAASATSGGALFAPTITMRNLTVSGTTTGGGTCVVGSYIWGAKLTVDHCEIYNGKYGLLALQGTNGTKGKLPTDLIFRPQLTVTNSLVVCGNSTPLYIVKPSQATGGMVSSVTVQNSVLVSGTSSHAMVNADFGTAGGTVSTTGCATREISGWSATAFDGSALDGYAYDIQSAWPITFKDGDTVLATLNVAHDAVPEYAAEKEGYALAGWIGEDSTEYTLDSVPTPAETGATTYTAKWVSQTAESVTVQFKNYDGSILQNITVYVGQSPSYSGDTPIKPSAGTTVFVFNGWSDGETTYTDTLPAASNDVTYTAVYREESMPWAYISSTDKTTYYATLLEAYNDGLVADAGVGIIKLTAPQYTIGASEYGSSASHTLNAPTKNVTIDLNGNELIDATGRNLVFVDADNFVLTLTSSNGTGTYTKSGGRGLVAFGGSGTTTAVIDRHNSVVVDNVNVSYRDAALIAGYRARLTVTIRNSTIVNSSDTISDKVVISFQSNKNWTSSIIAHYDLNFENVDITSDAIFWSSTIANSATTPAENCTASIKLAGTNTFNTRNEKFAPQYGFQYRNKSGDYWSLIDPANGYLVPSDSGTMAIVVLPEGPDNGVYTVKTFEGVPVYWDTNGDGTFDSMNGVRPGEAPTHEDGVKPFDAATKTLYTFIGWFDGETRYAPKALPKVQGQETVYYTAQFKPEVKEDITALLVDANGKEVPVDGDIQEQLNKLDGTEKSFRLLSDYALRADLDLNGVPVLDLDGHTISGDYSIVSAKDAVIKNGTVYSTADAAIVSTAGNLTLQDVEVHASRVAVDLQAPDSTNVLRTVTLYAGEARQSGDPALKVGSDTTKTTVAESFLVTGSTDAPLIYAEAPVEISRFNAYISDVYYEDHYNWYAETAEGFVHVVQWLAARVPETVPGTAFNEYRHVTASNPTAKIGSMYFETLYDAIKAVAKTGGTVTLLSDTDLEKEKAAGAGTGAQYYYVDSTKGAITIDLNGFTVYSSPTCRTFTLKGSNPITFMNGTLDFSDQGNTPGNYGVLLGTDGSSLRMLNVDMVAEIRGIYLSSGDVGKVVEIVGGSYSMTNTADDKGIVMFASNNTKTGGNTLRISENAKFTRNAKHAINLTKLDTCEITSAEFHVAANGKAISEDGVTVYVNSEQMTKMEDPASGTYIYTALEEQYVVENNGTKYTLLADALKAAKSGDTLKVLRNFSEKLSNAVIPASISISTNGHKMTFEAGSVVNGVEFTENRVIDPALNLKKVSLTIKDPLLMNLKFAASGLTVTAGTQTITNSTASGSYTAYSFKIADTEYKTNFDVWATDGTSYGIPEKVSVKRYADASQRGSNQKLKDLTASLMNYGTNGGSYPDEYQDVEYDSSKLNAGLEASGLTLTYPYDNSTKIEYRDIFGNLISVDTENSVKLPSIANAIQVVSVTLTDGSVKEDTLMNALKKSGSKYAAIYGYYAAKYFGK